MKNAPLYRRILSVALAVAMLFTLLVPMAGAEEAKAAEDKVEELVLTPIDASTLESQKLNKGSEKDYAEQEEHALNDVVRVSIALEKPSTLEAGFSADGIASNTAAMSYREGLRADQKAVTAAIEKKLGNKLDVRWNLTLAANFISANVLYGQIDAIKAVPGVKDVFLENRYEPQVDEKAEDEPNNGSASYMIGANYTWANGYYGAGSKVAIIDTGAMISHQSFDAEALEYAFQQTAEEKGMSYAEYVASLNLITAETIDAVSGQLNSGATGDKAYFNTKIGYGYSYIDNGYDITHDNDQQGDHGSHVSGIATANRFIKVDGEFKPALQAVGTQGVAPDAQLIVMKVFGKGGGAYDSDYMVAIEDAIILGCDSANLSLGSGAPGFSFSDGYEDVMNELVENGMVVAMSAGNSYSWYNTPYNEDMYPYLYMDDASYATNGSPGSFTNSLGVASVDNLGQTGMPLLFGDLHVFYGETSYNNPPITTLADQESINYIFFDNKAVDANGNDLLAPYADAIEGKVVLCSRGDSSFYQKVDAAAAHGAIGCIIYNNQAGTINMDLSSMTSHIPAVSITQADGAAIRAISEAVKDEEGNTLYYLGTMSVGAELEVQIPEVTDTVNISAFSSWGVPGSLVLKPEILAPGGSIYSVYGYGYESGNWVGGADQYVNFSGTSMASPQVAGMAAVMGQYIRENDLCAKTGLTERQLTNSLLMSTAHPVYDANGYYHPVIRVGAGLANVGDATNAKSYILMDEDSTMFPDSANDGKVKAELGDDPEYTGEYSYKFTVYPLEGEKEFTLRTDIFTQDYAGNGGYGMLQYTATVSLEEMIGYFGRSDPGYEAWYEVNGEVYEDTIQVEADVNGDGVTDRADAQAILDKVSGKLAEDAEFDAEAADLDGDGKITSYDARLILEAAATPAISAAEPTEVTVHIQLTPWAMAVLDYFGGGAYIQGYTYVDPVADEEGNLDVVHSIPILGYYGSWTDAAMLDRSSVIDAAYGTGKLPYLNNTNTNYLNLKDAKGETRIYMGNPYMVEDVFPAEKLALNSGDTITAFNYLNIRNVATLGFAVLDEDGKVVYSQASAANRYSAYYYVNGGAWQNYTPANYNVGKKLSATGVKEGDKVTVGFYALPEYYAIVAAKMNGEVAESGSLDKAGFDAILESGMLGAGAGIAYDVVIDDTAPVVKGALQDLITGDIYVKAQDENYIAYVAITNKSGTRVYFETVPEQTEAGQEIEVPLDLAGQNLPNDVVLLVADYAGNEAAFAVSLGGGEAEDLGGTMLTFTSNEKAPGSGNRALQLFKDELWYNHNSGEFGGQSVYSQVGFKVIAAEYVDGYVFMFADDGWIYAADLKLLDESARVGKWDGATSAVYDMAFNYKNKTMYVLGADNTVFSMDLITGEMIPVATISLPGQTGSYAAMNRLAIDDDGVFYTMNYGSTSYAKLWKFELPEPEEPEAELPEGYLYLWDFEEGIDGWSFVDADGDGYNWQLQNGMLADRWRVDPDDWAITPAIDLSDATSAQLSFQTYRGLSSYVEKFAVYAGTSTNIEEMVEIVPETESPTSQITVTADLSAYLGQSEVYIAIRHFNSPDMYYIYVDNVAILGERAPSEEPEEPVEIPELEAEVIGATSVYNYSYGGALAWDHDNDTLYLVSNYNATQDYDHYLWNVNPATGKATRPNEVGGTGTSSTNTSGRLYNCCAGLILVPGGGHLIEPTDEPTGILVEPEELNLMKGMTGEIVAAVFPWTLKDKDVTFESADPAIASVDNKGVVTAVEVGTTTITISTVAEPIMTAEVTVNVTEPPVAELRGIIWDENGKGQASVFKTNATNEWEALAVVGQLRWGALVGDVVYGSTDDTMYAFDADTYEVETFGGIVSMWIPSDACELPQDFRDAFAAMGYNVGPVIGPNNNGTYLTMLDPEAGSLIYFDLSDTDFGSDPMATFTGAGRGVYDDGDSVDEDGYVFYCMTESGALYAFTLNHEGSVMWELLGETGIDLTGVSDATNEIWASMVYDEENEFLYLSLYNGTDDYAHLYAIDANDTARNGAVGDFNENVWPVTGLYEYEPATDLCLKVNPTDLLLFEGESKEISIKVKLGETNEYTAEVADESVCTFEDGVVTAVKEGETTITITTVDTNEAGEHLTATVNVKVKGYKSVDLFVHGQVTDSKGARFTKISLDGAVVSNKGTDAPGDVTSGARAGDIYFAGQGSSYDILDAETFEPDYTWDEVDSYYSQYPAMDVANYPMFMNEDDELDNSRMLFTTSINWLVKPDYYGWNLSSFISDMAGVCFAGTAEADDGTALYMYYILGADGTLYNIGIDYVGSRRTDLTPVLDTGIVLADQNDASMTFVCSVDPLSGEYDEAGLVIADNGSKKLWYIDFMTEDEDDVVGLIGIMDVDNVSGLYGPFDALVTGDGSSAEEPEPEPVEPATLPVTWDFEENPLAKGWTMVDADGDGYKWTWNQKISSWFSSTPDLDSMAYEGKGAIISGSFINTVGELSPDNWAVSPPLDLTDVPAAEVSFYAKSLDASYLESFQVYAGTSADPASMVAISDYITAPSTYTQYTADLSAFAGEPEVYVAFRNYNTYDQYLVLIDYVEVVESDPANYYLVGSMNEWQPTEGYKFRSVGDGVYVIDSILLAAGDEFKIKDADLGESEGWYPAGTDNNYVVETDNDYQIIFYPEGIEDENYYYGFFRLIVNLAPPDPVYECSFETADEFNAWTNIDADGDNHSWQQASVLMAGYNIPAYDGADCVTSESYCEAGALTPNNWLVSPAIDLSGDEVQPDAVLSVYAVGQDPDYASEVFALYAGTSSDTSTMTKIGGDFTATGNWTQYTASLAEFVGQETVYVAIRHYNVTDMFYLNVDLVQVLPYNAEGEAVHDTVCGGPRKAADTDKAPVAPAMTYEAVPMAYEAKQLGDGRARLDTAISMTISNEMTKVGETDAIGSTNAIKGAVETIDLRALLDDTVLEDGTVVIDLTEDVNVNNGLFTVAYDPALLTFVQASSALELYSINEAEGLITFAYAGLEEVEAGNSLLKLTFSYAEGVDTVVTVKTLERNDKLALDETLEIPVKDEVEPTEPEDEIYELATALADGNKVVIYNPAFGKALSNEAVATNYRAGKDIAPENGMIINPDADIVWNVTEVEGGFELTDAEGHKLSIQAGKNNLPLDADDTVWEIQAAKDEGNVYVVSTTSVGSSGDHRAIEWYDRYSEFSAYYLSETSDETLFAQQLYVLGETGSLPTPPTPPEPEIADGFYLIGVNGWDVAALTENDKFDANPNAENEFMLETSLAVGNEIKVVKVENNEITAWYPDNAGNYVVDEAHAGDVTVYFRETYNSDWAEFGGFFFIAAAVVHEHAYGEPEWTWNEELTAATAKFVCECGDEQVLDAEITEVVTLEPTDKAEGEKTITAKVVFNGDEYTDVKTVVLDKLEHDCPCAAFTDMPEFGTVEHDAIDWAFTADPQVTNGTSDTTFSPEKTVTRGQAVTFLWRAAGCPEPTNTTHTFTDVKETAYYYKAMLWAVEKGITNGTSATTFGPNKTCTIEQILTFIYRFMEEPEVQNTENPWTDVKDGSFSFKAIMWAFENGIAAPKSETEFGRKDDCTRVAIVTYLYRIITGNGRLN